MAMLNYQICMFASDFKVSRMCVLYAPSWNPQKCSTQVAVDVCPKN
ncbi:hypothetical protein K239x_41850 [Planctomycetes bacterium K23_9]|uniref:Uncharacterized protein n=1 Tax=Stieleria marina TaxID=1930275 RepID=A0A517NYI1_9BACT|nr:hypothetical protein K239x_41850 [Planctomycetes bacterium K23_9]